MEHSKSVHVIARGYQDQLLQELAAKELPKDQRRRELARGLMNKYTRDLLTKNSTSAQNYYFQHTRLNSLFAKKQPWTAGSGGIVGGEFDGSKGLDLNSVLHLSMGIEDETNTLGVFGSFINILRHLLLIPTDSGLATRMWSLIEMFVHQIVISKDDGRKDIAKIGVGDFKIAFDAKDKPNIKERHKAMDSIDETLSILFPKLAAGNYDTDPNFQSSPASHELQRKLTSRVSKAALAFAAELPPSTTVTPEEKEKEDIATPQSDTQIPTPPPSGAPPPPPPPPSKMTAVAKPTMKRFNWVKLSPQQIHDTVFQEDKSLPSRIPVIAKDLERKFALKSSPGAASSSGVKQRGAVLHLLDAKKAQNLGILLTSIRVPAADICYSILSLDSSVLSVGNAISLLKLLPTEDEKSILLANKDAILGKPETFLLELLGISSLRERLEGYILKKEFEFRVEDGIKILAECKSCLDDVQNSSSLKSFLRLVLDIGNTMNKGYTDRNGGGAVGYKLSSILKLQDTKTSDNKSNLMVHIVEYVEECAPQILEMASEMPYLKQGSKEHLQCASAEMKDLSNQLRSLELTMKNFEPVDTKDPFLSTMTVTLLAFSAEVEELKHLFNSVSHFYGEDGDQEDFISTLVSFCNLLEKTQEDVAFVRVEAEKKAKKDANKNMSISLRSIQEQPRPETSTTVGQELPITSGNFSGPLATPDSKILHNSFPHISKKELSRHKSSHSQPKLPLPKIDAAHTRSSSLTDSHILSQSAAASYKKDFLPKHFQSENPLCFHTPSASPHKLYNSTNNMPSPVSPLSQSSLSPSTPISTSSSFSSPNSNSLQSTFSSPQYSSPRSSSPSFSSPKNSPSSSPKSSPKSRSKFDSSSTLPSSPLGSPPSPLTTSSPTFTNSLPQPPLTPSNQADLPRRPKPKKGFSFLGFRFSNSKS